MQLEQPYEGETNVLHYLEVLRDRVGFDELKKKVVKPLTGRKIGAYYGCLLLRPSSVLALMTRKIQPLLKILSVQSEQNLLFTVTATSAAEDIFP